MQFYLHEMFYRSLMNSEGDDRDALRRLSRRLRLHEENDEEEEEMSAAACAYERVRRGRRG